MENQGAVLITVLAVMVILLLLFLAAFTFIANRYSHHIRAQNRLIAKNLAQAGLTRGLLQVNSNGPIFDPISTVSPNAGKIEASFSAWGPYILVTSKGKYANQEVVCQSLIGTKPNELFDAAITVADETMPLVASGDTRIFGDVNTGSQGLTTGRMRGESITNEDFHKGKVNLYQSLSVPVIDSSVFYKYLDDVAEKKQECEMLVEGSAILTGEDNNLLLDNLCITIENNLRIQNISFSDFENRHSIYVSGFVEFVGNNRISGLLEIISTGPIFVGDSTSLDNVILMTPDSIVFTDKSFFSGTAISNVKIIVKENAQLQYPSLLLIRDGDYLEEIETGIFLNSKGRMESTCYVEQKMESNTKNNPTIYLDSTSEFTGIIVAQSKTDLRGVVNGCVFTERFHYFSPPTTYVNWLKDFKIDRTKLDYRPVLPFFESRVDSHRVAILRSDFLE